MGRSTARSCTQCRRPPSTASSPTLSALRSTPGEHKPGIRETDKKTARTERDPLNGVDDSKTLSRSHSAVVEKRERRRSNIETLRSAAKVRPRAPFYSRRMRTQKLERWVLPNHQEPGSSCVPTTVLRLMDLMDLTLKNFNRSPNPNTNRV